VKEGTREKKKEKKKENVHKLWCYVWNLRLPSKQTKNDHDVCNLYLLHLCVRIYINQNIILERIDKYYNECMPGMNDVV